jgi:hypothetical protein
MTKRAKTGVTKVTTGTVPMGTRPAASLHRRSMVEGMAGTTATCVMSSAAKIHVAELKTNAEIGCVTSRSNALKGTMTIMVLTMINLTGGILW